MSLLDTSLALLAQRIPGATAVFHQHNLDFCCGGKKSLRDAAIEKGLNPEELESTLNGMVNKPNAEVNWAEQTDQVIIEHLLERYHAIHRDQLNELIRLAQRVETVHGDNPNCPSGLAAHLQTMLQELEQHMFKEENILFPMILNGQGPMAKAPVGVMRHEHDDHAVSLRKIDELTNNITPPPGACNTWRALYLGLNALKTDLMDHIHIENNILFDRIDGELKQAASHSPCCGSCGG